MAKKRPACRLPTMPEYESRYRPWLLGLPALLTLACVGTVLGIAYWRQDSIRRHYRAKGHQALAKGNLDTARVYLRRLIDDAGEEPQDAFVWAQLLAREGDADGARRVIHRLAPDDAIGYPPAHREKAVELASRLSDRDAVTDELLDRLRRHLSRSGNDNPGQLNRLWAAYHFASGRPEDAIEPLAEAAKNEPELWFQVFALCDRLDKNERRKIYVGRAEDQWTSAIQANPGDVRSRIFLARLFVETDRADQAERLLTDGLALRDRPELRRALSDLSLWRLGRLDASESADTERFNAYYRELAKAIAIDRSNPSAYLRLLDVYRLAADEDRRRELQSRLERMVVEGEATPFAHFAIGTIYWLEGDGDNAVWHTEKAFSLNPGLAEVANNLAWLLAESEPPELDRAHELIRTVVDRHPQHPEFRHTLATILMKMQRWDEALTEFESLLPRTQGSRRAEIHDRLATIYETLGKETLAAMHRERAENLQSTDAGGR